MADDDEGSLEEFAAGLQIPETGTAAPPVEQAIEQQASLSRALVEQLKAKGLEGAGDDWSDDTLVDNLVSLQTKADRATELEAKIAALEAQQAQAVIQQTQQAKDPATQQAPAADEFVFPFKPVRVDPALRNLVTVDPATGMYIPTNQASVAHINAAEEMNKRRAYEQQLVQALMDDPESFGDVLTKKQISALEKKFSTQLEELKSQFTPIQQHTEQARQQAELIAFCDKNKTELYADDGQFTPTGNLVNELLTSGVYTTDKALEVARKVFPPQQATPAKTPSLSKKAAPQQQASRFVDQRNVQNRMPAEGNRFDGAKKQRESLRSIVEELREEMNQVN